MKIHQEVFINMKKEEIQVANNSIYLKRKAFNKRWNIIESNEDNNLI